MEKSIHQLNLAKTSHFLGIDFGTSKIGLALADPETKIAFAYGTLKNDKKFLHNLAEIIEKENVEVLVLGRSTMIQKDFDIEKIGEEIKNKLSVKIAYQEEMFTTKIAEANIKESGRQNIKKYDDAEAARIILQEWMDSNGK